MEKNFLRVWRAEENEALFNAASIAAAIEASPPSGKGLKEDYLALVKSMGVAIHPSLVPRAKLIADVLPEDALETVLDMTPYESMVSVVGTVLDRPSLCLLCEALTTATNIKTLKLVDVGLTSSSVSILAEYLPKLSVETLVLDFNNGPWKDSSSLASLILPANATPVCPLKVLSLRGCGIDDAIADNIAITVGLNYGSTTMNAVDSIPEVTMSSMELSLGAAYFFGDNYYAQAQLVLGSVDDGSGSDPASSTGYGIGLGKFIPVKDMWFISPQLNYVGGSNDSGSSAGAEIRIRFGATF